ncbi:MAG: CRTAC1 family protein, partial [Pirellulaceae bacterium]|nr:CRTAC1 family protein [Pirellulaceae bacterium]
DDRWSTSSGWFDYNNDGLLDLYVCNYVQWSREIDLGQDFRLVGVGRAYGPPTAFSGTFPYLYRNDGNGKFSDVSASMGVQVKNNDTGVPVAKSMGLAPIDINRDGWIDLIVSNDTVQNFLFINQQGKRFKEMGQVAGIAYDSKGSARGAMGIDTAHFRNGRLDNGKVSSNLSTIGVAIGNFANEMSALYVSEGGQMNFRDEAVSTGLGPPTRLDLTFGLFFFDYDLDGRLDLFGANGHLEEEINKVQPSQFHAQEPQLFWNAGLGGRSEFLRVANDTLGSGFASRMVGRGSTCADIDSDGDLDVLLTAAGGRPRLLRNDQETGNHWVRFLLVGQVVNRDAIGSWVEVYCGDEVFRRQVMPTRSYLSQSEKAVTFGLGQHEKIDKVVIYWAGFKPQELGAVAVDKLHRVDQQ